MPLSGERGLRKSLMSFSTLRDHLRRIFPFKRLDLLSLAGFSLSRTALTDKITSSEMRSSSRYPSPFPVVPFLVKGNVPPLRIFLSRWQICFLCARNVPRFAGGFRAALALASGVLLALSALLLRSLKGPFMQALCSLQVNLRSMWDDFPLAEQKSFLLLR